MLLKWCYRRVGRDLIYFGLAFLPAMLTYAYISIDLADPEEFTVPAFSELGELWYGSFKFYKWANIVNLAFYYDSTVLYLYSVSYLSYKRVKPLFTETGMKSTTGVPKSSSR